MVETNSLPRESGAKHWQVFRRTYSARLDRGVAEAVSQRAVSRQNFRELLVFSDGSHFLLYLIILVSIIESRPKVKKAVADLLLISFPEVLIALPNRGKSDTCDLL